MIQPIVSICIPTYGRVEILKKTLDSIFSQNVNPELFEVCISDNSPTDETKKMLKEFFADKTNICYSKSTCEGYYNSIESLKLGSGKFLKLQNNYSEFNAKMFEKFISRLSDYEETKPVVFFAFGTLKQKEECCSYGTFDEFLNAISYYSTWSTSFGIWKRDFDSIMKRNVGLDKMFPHTSLLFELFDKNNYVVDNELYFDNQDVGKKGGYNLPETFGTRYLGMCKILLSENKIAEKTYQKIKTGILQFIADWYVSVTYFGDKYTFNYDNWENIITNLYGSYGVKYIKQNAKKARWKVFAKKMLRRY